MDPTAAFPPDGHDDLERHRSLTEQVGLLPDREAFDGTVQRAVTLAREAVAGCDSASVTILTEDEAPGRTVAGTDDLALLLDEFQYRQDDGPCLDASARGLPVEVPAMRAEERWGQFPAEAVRHGVLASLSLPLRVRGTRLGALNLYSRDEDPFTPRGRETGIELATQAAVAIANAQVYDASRRLAEQLEEAMRSRATIEQAKGILMGERGCDADAAFEMLRAASQRQNVKLREVAQRLVDSKTRLPGQ
ncbi:MAG TPA: GAF and ANTAR domain-containing protein [Mycobacteriales bacterium]|jgi:GAF domain-containing protein|nr:GAF and ANTAR domain-containing protein [Mycobacteriales bacterium]